MPLHVCHLQALGFPEGSLKPAHRLDAGTQGVVVLSRTTACTRFFQELLSDKQDTLPAGGAAAASQPATAAVEAAGGVQEHHEVLGGTTDEDYFIGLKLTLKRSVWPEHQLVVIVKYLSG